MSLNPQPALHVQGVSAGYASHPQALQQADFKVFPQERVGVLGPNGAGKSTLFKAIAGLIPLASGQISIHGEDCRTSHQLVGYIPQHHDIDWRFPVNVRDVVMMGRTRHIGWLRFPTGRDWRIVDDMLARVGMAEFRHRQIGELSGGQRQRVFIARVLAQETDVMLLDEPFSGVDVTAEEEILQILAQLQAEGVTMLLATHDLSAAQTQFDKLLLLNRTVVAYGTPEQVFQPDYLRATYGRRVGFLQEADHLVVVADNHS